MGRVVIRYAALEKTNAALVVWRTTQRLLSRRRFESQSPAGGVYLEPR